MHELTAGPLLFRHEAKSGATRGEISGHFHPKFGANVRGRRVGGRCFVADMRRLILPAFGAYTGGLDVGDPAIAGLFPRGARALCSAATESTASASPPSDSDGRGAGHPLVPPGSAAARTIRR